AFFEDIDVLVFPTQYRNEAEPLVLHEAMSRKLPVIAYGRGAIPEIVGEGGVVIDPNEPFVPHALKQIVSWLQSPAEFCSASKAAAARFRKTLSLNEERWKTLVETITAAG